MTVISLELLTEIRKQYRLDWNGIHGFPHFLRVREIGLRLAEMNTAKSHVVELFAFLHDSMRHNDGHDPGHGKRAAMLVRSLQATLPVLSREELDLLAFACEFHTDGLLDGDVTVQTCWDADRLDLGRVGIMPVPNRLCTPAAKDSAMIEWAYGLLENRISETSSLGYRSDSVHHGLFLPVQSRGKW